MDPTTSIINTQYKRTTIMAVGFMFIIKPEEPSAELCQTIIKARDIIDAASIFATYHGLTVEKISESGEAIVFSKNIKASCCRFRTLENYIEK